MDNDTKGAPSVAPSRGARPAAIVTGASSGIGAETAVALSSLGYDVVLAARRADMLERVARRCRQAGGGLGATAIVVPTDVAVEAQVSGLVDRAYGEFGRVDVMVNNAGYGFVSRVAQLPTEELRRLMDVNFFGVFFGCKAVVPIMVRQGSGHIFNVSSILGKQGTPYDGAYCSSKFAVCGLSDSLRVEMLEHNIRVTTVCPGLTDTGFFAAERGMFDYDLNTLSYARKRPASTVARAIVHAIGKNRPEILLTPDGRFLAWLGKLSPRLADRLTKHYYDDMRRAERKAANAE